MKDNFNGRIIGEIIWKLINVNEELAS